MNEKRNSLPEVSIVLLNYNHAEFLEDRIKSFQCQSLVPAEIIIVDDGSTDGSWEILQEAARQDSSIVLIKRPENGGIHAALSDGLRAACKPFVVTAAADDVWTKDFLFHSARLLASHPDAAFVFSDPAEILDVSATERTYPNFVGNAPLCLSPDEFLEMLRRRSFRIASNTVMFRRTMLAQIGGFHQEHQWHTDWLAIMRLGLAHGVCYLPEVLSYFRVREGSYSDVSLSRKSGHIDATIACLNTIYESGDQQLITRFRKSGLLPQYNFWMLPQLLTYQVFRRHLSPTLLKWLLVRPLWASIRPFVSVRFRRGVRNLVNKL